ncbi:hypothetical protein J121_633 [Qipengyuania citrea LAMA 915]|uniref:Uncharacterized protein n=1 Tax=Qipengyuania citrea LAMA 915 TaxID=1306953 RepID=A0A0L1KCD2_9SPHN|nr:hypothetical protein J121_633 [Qipengyuania citrea LAMA 915]
MFNEKRAESVPDRLERVRTYGFSQPKASLCRMLQHRDDAGAIGG